MSNINKLVNESVVQTLGITPERALSVGRQAAVWGLVGGYLGHKATEDSKRKKDVVYFFKQPKKHISKKQKEAIKLRKRKIAKIVGAGALAGALGA